MVIGSIGGEGVKNISTFSNIEVFADRAMDRSSSFYYGTQLPDHLEFTMTIVNKHGHFYESWEVQIIQNWLFGRREPHLLTIFDPDKMNVSYECWLVDPEMIKIANKPVGWSFTVRCTTPYSITNIKTKIIECPTETTTVKYWNHSDIEDYIYPELKIQLSNDTTDIIIENKSDNNRVFELKGLRPNEEIYVNNDLCYMTTKSGDNILKNFNYNFFRVVEGLNILEITGKCVITLETRFKKAVGGF